MGAKANPEMYNMWWVRSERLEHRYPCKIFNGVTKNPSVTILPRLVSQGQTILSTI